jgi:hypothetical protein
MVKAQCFKEKKQVEVKNPEYVINKIGRAMVKGVCPHCGTKVNKFLSDSEIPDDLRSKLKKKGSGSRLSKSGGGPRKSKRRSHKSGGAPRKSKRRSTARKSGGRK